MKRITIFLLLTMLVSTLVFAEKYEKEMEGDGDSINIAFVMDAGKKAKNGKHVYGYLTRGLKKAGISQKVRIDFIATKDAEEDIFDTYAVVVAISEKDTERMSTSLSTFVSSNKDEDNLFVLALLPKKSEQSELSEPPKDIDVLSSVSAKSGAAKLVSEDLANAIADYLLNDNEEES